MAAPTGNLTYANGHFENVDLDVGLNHECRFGMSGSSPNRMNAGSMAHLLQ